MASSGRYRGAKAALAASDQCGDRPLSPARARGRSAVSSDRDRRTLSRAAGAPHRLSAGAREPRRYPGPAQARPAGPARPQALQPGSRREPPRPEPLLTIVPPANARPRPLPARLATISRLSPDLATRRRKLTLALPYLRASPADICVGRRSARASARSSCGRCSTPTRWITPSTSTPGIFQVLSRNGRPPPFPAWHDTVNLRPGDRVELLVPFRGFAGRTVYHCHIAEHGDIGMIGVIEVSA